jgi:hypothetical protein
MASISMCSFVQYCYVTKVMIIHKKIKLNLDWYKQYMKVMKFNHPSILKATLLEPNTEISPFQLYTYFKFWLLNSRERNHLLFTFSFF